MPTTMITPKWEWKTHPCPECGQETLKYDGSVKWGNGPRPGRELATKGPVGFSPRAAFEVAHYFHCEKCGTRFYDPVDGRQPRLFRERSAKSDKKETSKPVDSHRLRLSRAQSAKFDEKEINKLAFGLSASEHPDYPDFREAMMYAAKYRKECHQKLIGLGAGIVPYLMPHIWMPEVQNVLKEFNAFDIDTIIEHMQRSNNTTQGVLLYIIKHPGDENKERLLPILRQYNNKEIELGTRLLAISALIKFGEPDLKSSVLELFPKILALGEVSAEDQTIQFSYSAYVKLERVLTQLAEVQAKETAPQLEELLPRCEPKIQKIIQETIDSFTSTAKG